VYQKFVLEWFKKHAHEFGVVEQLERFKDAALVLWHLDLEPARPVLARCYAPNPRGGSPWDPVVMLRCLLLALLVDQPSLNEWPKDLGGICVLRVLAGIEQDRERMLTEGCRPEELPVRPGVGTLYDFLHRLHDGPVRKTCEHVERPSENERRRAKTPRKLKKKPKKPKQERKRRARKRRKKRDANPAPAGATDDRQAQTEDQVQTAAVTEKLVQELEKAADLPNPNDLQQRLGEILVSVAVLESARKGLLGDVKKLITAGDGSPLRTGGNPHGKRVCGHPFDERCDCPRLYSDPDAQWGWDSHRKVWFFGNHFYEVSTSECGHDLPLAIGIDPGNCSDFTASLNTLDRFYNQVRELGWGIGCFIADAGGHDSQPIYRYLLNHGTTPVIPLKSPAPATHPVRSDVNLSKRGVPVCKAGAEMASWGSARLDRSVFICPVKAGRLARCPLAPDSQPDWVCRPDQAWGPSVSIKHDDNPRLCPPIARNTVRFQQRYNLRSGTERSNSVKKEAFGLEKARHRRTSFWLIRLHLIAVLQHGKAWVAEENADALVDHLLGRDQVRLAA